MIEIAQRVEFLRRIHLFDRLEDDHFSLIAQKVQEKVFQPGDVIVRQGEEDNRFFMIYSGSVNVDRQNQRGGHVQEKRVPGDYFGEESLLMHRRCNATATAVEKTVLLVLLRVDFDQLLKKVRQLKSNFGVAVTSHRLARNMQFKWLRESEGEVIYFLARKHPILLLQALLVPVILAGIAFLGLSVGLVIQNPWLLWTCIIGLGLVIGWGIWKGVDWGNDYYIVTNQRVVWLEKVVGIYDSRREAPLSAIQRVNVQMGIWGQQLDYGNLIVRTIVGSTLTLRNISHPYQAAALIEEHWKRSRETSHKMEEDAMRQALRERLLRKQPVPAPAPSLIENPVPKKNDPNAEQRGFSNFFRLRLEGLSTITYRKHWIVLIEKTWLPNLILLALIGGLVYEIVHGVDALLVVLFLIFILILGWWYYQYLDWSNDVFQVTPDQILDIGKKPIGEVTSDIASLDNILHLEYERKGLLQILFNYGNVYITIGGGKDMTFENVFDPSAVQDDIERRRLGRVAQKEQVAIKAERERVADWFAAYHRSSEEFRQAEEEEGKSNETDGK